MVQIINDVPVLLEDTWSTSLLKLIDERKLRDSQVYKSSGVSKQTFSKIRTREDYVPTKDTAIQLCIALDLGLIESETLIKKAGLALSKSTLRDIVIRYCLENHINSLINVNMILKNHNCRMLGC